MNLNTKGIRDLITNILDRGNPVTDVEEKIVEHHSFDMYERKPGIALLDNGVLQAGNLDLSCVMLELAKRGAVINIPKYRRRRAKSVKEGEWNVSSQHRHGKIIGLVANKEVFSFSFRIKDMNVTTTDDVGAFRTFMIVDVDGEWYEGWETLEFIPTAKENDFLLKGGAAKMLRFEHFVHPNRWACFYGSYYVAAKLLLQRMEEEREFLNSERTRLEGKKIPLTTERRAKESVVHPKSTTDRSGVEAITVKAFEAEVDAEFTGKFAQLPDDPKSYDVIANRLHDMTYGIGPKLQFAVRSTELVFSKAGGSAKGYPRWVNGTRGWDEHKIARTTWNRFTFDADSALGSLGIALRYRERDKTERVNVG